jgi:hypothetical protein
MNPNEWRYTGKRRITTARQFGDAMGAIGGCLQQSHMELLVEMAWGLIPPNKLRASVLRPAHPYLPRDLDEMPTARHRRIPTKRRTGGGKGGAR